MRIAFYAPLKSPRHPVPSGDRLIARMFVCALQRAGHAVSLPLHLRTWDGTGDPQRQRRIARLGQAFADRLIERGRNDPTRAPQAWFSYHVYHKAPDWTGPLVSAALDIPYLIAEASVAQKQRHRPWHEGHAAAVAAIRAADAVICINPADIAGVAAVRGGPAQVRQLAPFLDVEAFTSPGPGEDAPDGESLLSRLPSDSPRLVTVAMMRHDNKLASYRVLASALARVTHRPWHLLIVGDGQARAEVEAAFADFATGRVHFAGVRSPASVASLLATCDLFVWPAVDEVIGMGLLEAQACGVPVVAGRGVGVASVVEDGGSGGLVPAGDDQALADALLALLGDPSRRRAMARHARSYVLRRHDLPAAAAALDAIVAQAVDRRGARPR